MKSLLKVNVSAVFMNNSEEKDYSRTEVAVAARKWLMKL
jgi:hypothetical protein